MKEAFHLEHSYDRKGGGICHICKAEDAPTPLSYANCHLDAPWSSALRTQAEFQSSQDRLSVSNPLTCITGFHFNMLVFESMHADLLGLRLHLLGSCIVCLLDEGIPCMPPPTGSWQSKRKVQLSVLSNRLRVWLRRTKMFCKFKKITLGRLRLYTLRSWPELKSKAKNAAVLTEFVLDIHRNIQTPSVHQRYRTLCLWGFSEYYKLCSNKERWFDDPSLRRMRVIRDAMLHSYHYLNAKAARDNVSLFAMKPKFHAIDEIIRHSLRSRLNPGAYWSFSSEDLCGQVGSLAAKVHPSTMSLRTAQRWIAVFFSEARSCEIPGP